MLKFVCAAVAGALVACAASAQTADVAPVSAASSWTGPYIGIHGGYGFDAGDKISNQGITDNNIAAIGAGLRASEYNQNRAGFLGGGQAGFNLQSGNIVYGVEGDFSYMRQRGTSDYYGTDTRRTQIRSDLDWMATVRGRLGYSFGRGMIFGTGGYAVGRVKGSAEFDAIDPAQVNYYGSHAYVAQGWTAGAGLEFRPFTQGSLSRVSFKLESDYYDLGRSHIDAGQTADRPGYYVLGVETKGYNAKFGINYAF